MLNFRCQFKAQPEPLTEERKSGGVDWGAWAETVPGHKNRKYIHQGSFGWREEKDFDWSGAHHQPQHHLFGWTHHWARFDNCPAGHPALERPLQQRENHHFDNPSTLILTFLWIWPAHAVSRWQVHLRRRGWKVLWVFRANGLPMPIVDECLWILLGFDELPSRIAVRRGLLRIEESRAWPQDQQNGVILQEFPTVPEHQIKRKPIPSPARKQHKRLHLYGVLAYLPPFPALPVQKPNGFHTKDSPVRLHRYHRNYRLWKGTLMS